LEQQTLKEMFELLKKLYNVFDVNGNGKIEKKEFRVLLEFDLIDAKGAERLDKWDTNVSGSFEFKEFVAYFATEFILQGASVDKSAKEEKGGDKPLPEYLQNGLPPLAFRIICRTEDFNRVFGLLKSMFDAFDSKKAGLIGKSQIKRLVALDLFTQKDVDQMLGWKTTKSDALTFNEFLAFWIGKYVELDFKANEKKEEKEDKSGRGKALGPIIHRLTSARHDIKKIYDLIRSLFNVFDEKKEGSIIRAEFAELVKDGLLDDHSHKALMALETSKDGSISFSQFLAFMIQELAQEKAR
jgi:Ca2+-binding EF-hand superfamily protein